MSTSTEGVFYPGKFTDDEKRDIKKSHIWPVLMGMHFSQNGNVFCGSFKREGSTPIAMMVTAEGVRVCRVSYGENSNYHVHTCTDDGSINHKPVVKSKNSRYVVGKLSDGGSVNADISDRIKARQADYLVRPLAWMGERFGDCLEIGSVDESLLSGQAQRMLVFLHKGDIDCIPDYNVKMAIDGAYINYKKRIAAAEAGAVKIAEMLDREKWLICNTYDGMICGAVHPKLASGVLAYTRAGRHTTFPRNLCTPEVTVPFRLYRDNVNIDPAFRNQLMGAWTMFKIHVGDDSGTWLDSLVPNENYKCWQDAGAIAWRYGHHTWLMIDK